jgi:hypothetical protein
MKTVVCIEFKRVQTFLFAVPRLADIVGANALLGETLRYDLPQLAKEFGAVKINPIPTNLATDILEDPISEKTSKNSPTIMDNPNEQWNQGILARDGGHFRAHFDVQDKAELFARAALNMLRQHLPGLRCEIECISLPEWLNKSQNKNQDDDWKPFKAVSSIALFSLPMLQQCEESGNGPASYLQRYLTGTALEERAIGLPAKIRKAAWQKFKDNKTDDLAAIMGRKLQLASRADSFEELCSGDYLALIHADGNGLGKAMKAISSNSDFQGLSREATIESFFHRMRVTLRQALAKAITQLYETENREREGLQILMLGGDDLLIACRAPLALPLVKHLAQALVDIQQTNDNPTTSLQNLTIGVGIAIAKPSFPFHRLHDLAEELAASAKRLVRNMEQPVSVVDWAICSQAWHGDLKDVRRSSQYLAYTVNSEIETLALSAKPYRILQEADHSSLQALLEKQNTLPEAAQKDAARSQLRDLVRQMRKGRRQADQALLDLQIASPKTYEAFKAIGFGNTLWRKLGQGRWYSEFADWVEITEIPRLQTDKSQQDMKVMEDVN